MRRRILLLAVMALGAIAVGNVGVAPDAPISSQLTPYLEPAREMARSSMWFAGVFPTRFVEARCSEDGRAADLTFESALASIRSYATIGFLCPEDWYAPGATTAIVGQVSRRLMWPDRCPATWLKSGHRADGPRVRPRSRKVALSGCRLVGDHSH